MPKSVNAKTLNPVEQGVLDVPGMTDHMAAATNEMGMEIWQDRFCWGIFQQAMCDHQRIWECMGCMNGSHFLRESILNAGFPQGAYFSSSLTQFGQICQEASAFQRRLLCLLLANGAFDGRYQGS